MLMCNMDNVLMRILIAKDNTIYSQIYVICMFGLGGMCHFISEPTTICQSLASYVTLKIPNNSAFIKCVTIYILFTKRSRYQMYPL
jgi:hypothetical protein